MDFNTQIKIAFTSALGYVPSEDELQKFQRALGQDGLTVTLIPEKQVHDVDRLILAEKIVATRRNIQKMRATEVFENHADLVKNLDKDVAEYFETYVVSGEGLGDGQ